MPRATTLVPLWDRQAEWRRRLAMVESARSFIYLTTFYTEPDAYGLAMLHALQAAQQRGVAVTYVIDGFGQRLGGVLVTETDRGLLHTEIEKLRAAGGCVIFYEPPRLAQRLLGGGHHIKIQVSDAGEAIFGSSNVTKVSFEGWNEYAVAVCGPVVLDLLETVGSLGVEIEKMHRDQLAGVANEARAAMDLEYWYYNPNFGQGFLGPLFWRGMNSVTEKMIEMLDAAKRSVSITSFYFKPTRALLRAVLRAAHRGVRIEVFHSHRDALESTDLAWIAAATGYKRLLKAGVRIFENLCGEHSKLVLVDEAWVAFGTYNFEDAAHDRLAEAMLATRDKSAVEPARAIFSGLRRHPNNVEVTLKSYGQLPLAERMRIARYGRFKWWM